MQANDFCEICRRPLSQQDTDWERWETSGKLVHKNCVIAQSSVKATGRGVKKYANKPIPSGLIGKILKDNTIKVKIINKGSRQAPDIDEFDKEQEV